MARIVSGNVEIYVRQLLSEALGNDVDLLNSATDEDFIKDEYFKLTHRRISEESKDNR